ncbi:sortase [Candidatus Saccharibacteria bacterium]|nr:sortase [Candidatus Saccharibacteria bacterium]
MELKKRFSLRKVFIILYSFLLSVYLIVGFLPTKSIYAIDTQLKIPAINLVSDVTILESKNGKLDTPDLIVGSFSRAENKTLLVGHSTTIFENLDKLKINDTVIYKSKLYKVKKRELLEKNEISMRQVLKNESDDTIVLMTCAGEMLENMDATHRLIVTATKL